jgi:hypothetical protein
MRLVAETCMHRVVKQTVMYLLVEQMIAWKLSRFLSQYHVIKTNRTRIVISIMTDVLLRYYGNRQRGYYVICRTLEIRYGKYEED